MNKTNRRMGAATRWLAATAWAAALGTMAAEPWRPAFHFTPERNWMNDPNGMVYHDGEYHLFYQYNPEGDKWGHMSWGHAVSRDLLHWDRLPLALPEQPAYMIFSGSAVVDAANTSGFGVAGRPPMVAIYTAHHTDRPLQAQHLAYSNDRGRTWTQYAGNPVLDIGEADFRDPKVAWHEATKRWVMPVSWPTHRQVRFYASPNLRDWTHLSDFGPAGSTSGIWECPDLFQLRGAGKPRWVLVVNVGSGAPAGGSGTQYFVGDFDGTRFVIDPSYPSPSPAFIPDGRVLGDFEDGYGGWKATGTAFGKSPATGALPGQQAVDGFRGRGLANSFVGGDAAVGTLESPAFAVDAGYISFLVGGGNHPGETCVNLRIDGRTVRTATGDDTERLDWKSWDVREFRGKTATVEIVDRHAGGWGHIGVDHVVLAVQPARRAAQPALWADYGPDFYAAVSWSGVPRADGRALWLGWMSNWVYANDVPTSPWRSAMSVPRELALRATTEGLRLVQRPVRELTRLRGPAPSLRAPSLRAANEWLASHRIASGPLQLRVGFGPRDTGRQGVALFVGNGAETTVGIDRDLGTVYVDRTRSGKTDFHAGFAGVFSAPLPRANDNVWLELVVDESSVEVFANDGERVLTSLVLPPESGRGIALFGPDDSRIVSLEAWPLRTRRDH